MVKRSIYKSSQCRCSLRKGVLGNFAKFTGKHLCQSLFFNKFAGLGPATLLKKRFWHRCFPMNFAKLLRTTFSQNTSGRLLLNLASQIFDRNLKYTFVFYYINYVKISGVIIINQALSFAMDLLEKKLSYLSLVSLTLLIN